MTRAEAIEHFGSVSALADKLGITTQAIYDWGDKVPTLRQFQLQIMTEGKLKADSEKVGTAA